MRFTSTLLVVGLLGSPGLVLRAQAPVDVSGHWEGTAQIPDGTVSVFEIDLATDPAGRLMGTVSMPTEHLKGLPLTRVLVQGRTVTLVAREDQPMIGVVSDDGVTIQGDVAFEQFTIPMSMTRTGEARFDHPAPSPAVGPDLEGHWSATTNGPGGAIRLTLVVANQPDGTATAYIANLNEGGLRIPAAAIARDGARVALALTAVEGSFEGTLREDELSGTYRQGSAAVALTFRKDLDR